MLGRATSGGTDSIAVALSEKRNVDAWNAILLGNAVLLAAAGFLFGWDKALYSIVFQFASNQVVRALNFRYKRATLFYGMGLYNGDPRTMIYSGISGNQVKTITKQVRMIDPQAFVNVIKTDQVAGNCYRIPND